MDRNEPTLVLVKHAMPEIDSQLPASLWPISSAGRAASAVLANRLARYRPTRVVTSIEPKAAETGAIVGTASLMLFLEGSRFLRDIVPGVSEVDMASVRIGAVGLLLVLFIMYRPQGLMGDYTKR